MGEGGGGGAIRGGWEWKGAQARDVCDVLQKLMCSYK